MRKKGRLYLTALCLILLLMVLIFLLFQSLESDYDTEILSQDYIGTGELAQELGFDLYSSTEWEEWFDTYQKDYLTGEMLNALLTQLGVSDYITADIKKNTAVPRTDWNEIYEKILSYLDMKGEVSRQTILLLDGMEAAEGQLLVCSQGDYSTSLPESFFDTWMAYDVYVSGEKIIGIKGVSSAENTIPNVYLKSITEETIDFLYSGAEYEKTVSEQETALQPGVCDLVFTSGELTGILRKQDTITGDMISYDDSAIEIQGYGKIRHTGKIPVYRTYGEITEKSISDVVLGNMKLEYVTAGEEVCAILIRQPASIETIRVLLLADDGSKYRSEVFLKTDTNAQVKNGTEEYLLEAGTVLAVAEALHTEEDTLSVTPEGSGKIYICDADGTPVSNGYYGVMEVRMYSSGYTLVNQLPFEQYLYAVVPSEMPVSYEMEALKAQAVCARSYAYIQLLKGNLAAFGAHMDDSTSYQVYNKVAETEESITAVDETHGQVISYQGEIAEAYFFSTSAGYTDTTAVWNQTGAEAGGYLQVFCLNTTDFDGNLANEADFARYITSDDITGYDSDLRYSRWRITADYRGKTDEINAILTARKESSPENILFYKADGETPAEDISSMGELTGITVAERSSSGCILTLQLVYQEGTVLVKNEYNIRKILAVGATGLVFGDGTEGTPGTLLPSAFTTVEKQEDGTWLLCGGGYGHGLGMSQNGANGMAKAGMDYEEILHSFYKDVELVNMETKGET